MDNESTGIGSVNGDPNLNPSRQEIVGQKQILDEISKNTKELENFLNLNQRLRNNINEVVQSYLGNNEESKFILLNKNSNLKSNIIIKMIYRNLYFYKYSSISFFRRSCVRTM